MNPCYMNPCVQLQQGSQQLHKHSNSPAAAKGGQGSRPLHAMHLPAWSNVLMLQALFTDMTTAVRGEKPKRACSSSCSSGKTGAQHKQQLLSISGIMSHHNPIIPLLLKASHALTA